MTTVSEPVYRSRASSLALRYALRELRGGLRGFYVFIACIALGVMAIAGVGSVAASLSEGLTREGRTLLGGDVAFSLIQREAKPEEIAFLRARGQVSVAAALRVMARSSDGKLALVELKAVDGNYPMLGEVTLDPKMPMADLLAERQDTLAPRSARRSIPRCWRGSISSSATASQSATPRSRSEARSRPSRTSSPAMSGWARAFWSASRACAPPDCCSPAAWCAGSTA